MCLDVEKGCLSDDRLASCFRVYRGRSLGDKAVRGSARHNDRVTDHVHVNSGSTAPSSHALSCPTALRVGGLRGLLSFFFIIPCCLMQPERPQWMEWM